MQGEGGEGSARTSLDSERNGWGCPEFSLSGMGTATLSAIIIYQLSGRRRTAAA